MFRFNCETCGECHEGMPTYGEEAPLYYYSVPEAERGERCHLTSDHCIIDGKWTFVRGCIEIPVHGAEEPFVWGVWVSLGGASFKEYQRLYAESERASFGPFFGWLSAALPLYPETENLKTHVHLRDNGIRPYIELEATDHPLAQEQINGIPVYRVAEIHSFFEHRGAGA